MEHRTTGSVKPSARNYHTTVYVFKSLLKRVGSEIN